jgi:hypothetical protein
VPPTEEPTDEPTTEPTDEPTDDEAACANAKNHGEYVSSVAHSTPPGPGHGAAVSAAAHSTCGKPGSDDATDDQRAGKDKRSTKVKDKVKTVPPGQAKKDDPSYSPGNSDHTAVSHGNSAGHSNAGGNGKGKDK